MRFNYQREFGFQNLHFHSITCLKGENTIYYTILNTGEEENKKNVLSFAKSNLKMHHSAFVRYLVLRPDTYFNAQLSILFKGGSLAVI